MERIGAGASPGFNPLPSAAPHRRTPDPHPAEDAKDRRFVPAEGWGTSRAACTCPCTAPSPHHRVWALAKQPTFCARPEPTSICVNTHDAPRRQEEPRHSTRGPGSRSPQIEAEPPEVISTQYSKISPSRPEKKQVHTFANTTPGAQTHRPPGHMSTHQHRHS